ncbi:MAG: hypothetical protein JWM87_173 [Candidatus Eremiobacteraeota bacterium]|nr:hypothetical protein [Candidatus Eremiobacteraeota bacterium]
MLLLSVAIAGCGGKPLQTVAHPVFLAGAEAADLIDVVAGGILAMKHPGVSVGRTQCPTLLNLSGGAVAECTIPVAGKTLRIGVKGDVRHPSFVDVEAILIMRDAERDVARELEDRYHTRFTVRCDGPAIAIVALRTRVDCAVAPPGGLRRVEHVYVSDRTGHVVDFGRGAAPNSAWLDLGEAVTRRTSGGITIGGAVAERYVRAIAGGAAHDELVRRKLLGAAHCPARVALVSGKHGTCTVALGEQALTFDLRFDEGRGFIAQPSGTVMVVSQARDLVRRAYEHALRVEGKPQRVRVRCASEPVFIGEPGEALPCNVATAAGLQVVLLQLLDAQGNIDILPEPRAQDGASTPGR